MKTLKIRKKVVPDLIFFTAQRSENITFSKYAFYFINNSLYFITLYIINDSSSMYSAYTCYKDLCQIVT